MAERQSVRPRSVRFKEPVTKEYFSQSTPRRGLKRRRSSPKTSATEYTTHHLEENITILDYVLFKATEFVLTEPDPGDTNFEEHLGLHIDMSDYWLHFFALMHGRDAIPPRIKLRARLLQLSILFCGQYSANDAVRRESTKCRSQTLHRARMFWSNRRDLSSLKDLGPSSLAMDQTVYRNLVRAYVEDLEYSDSELEEVKNGRNIQLGDILNLFLELTASTVRFKKEWTVSTAWMGLLGEWMRQAVLEQVLLYNARNWEDIAHIFALGSVSVSQNTTSNTAHTLNTLFGNGEGDRVEESKDWARIRRQVVSEFSSKDRTFTETIKGVIDRHPVNHFRQMVLRFFNALHSELPTPDLQQIENGRIEGVSPEESAEILARIGNLSP